MENWLNSALLLENPSLGSRAVYVHAQMLTWAVAFSLSEYRPPLEAEI